MKTHIIDELHSMITHKKHIIWDWNGTLLADVDHAIAVVNNLLLEHSLPQINRPTYQNIFDFPVIKYYEKLGFDFTRVSFEKLCHQFVDQFMKNVYDLPIIPEMKQVLQTLHREGISQSVLSASDQHSLDSMITHFQLGHLFKNVYGVDNKLAASKVQRGHELIQQSGFSLEETVIIGDTIHDLEVAQALQIDAVLISHGHQSAERLRAHHHQVIEVL